MAENDTGEGPARLFQDTQSAFSFHLLYVLNVYYITTNKYRRNDWQNLVISTVPQKIEQLGLLTSHLSALDFVDTNKAEWDQFAALFCQVLTHSMQI
jgi:hypothetical protein